ncbi:hypothetical protein V5799_016907 [Amblyomma americanum]|uniref:Secreted protein n=1 Tax=Amblyomma americanum TaxID=6943 RepID=A0AAQ4F4K5_AMBAM
MCACARWRELVSSHLLWRVISFLCFLCLVTHSGRAAPAPGAFLQGRQRELAGDFSTRAPSPRCSPPRMT